MMWLGDADRGTGAGQPGGWIYQLLPFLGHENIHDLGAGQGPSTSVNTSSYKYTTAGPIMKSSAISEIICLSRRKVSIYPDAISQGAYNSALPSSLSGQMVNNTVFVGGLNKTDYACNAGSGPDPGDAF